MMASTKLSALALVAGALALGTARALILDPLPLSDWTSGTSVFWGGPQVRLRARRGLRSTRLYRVLAGVSVGVLCQLLPLRITQAAADDLQSCAFIMSPTCAGRPRRPLQRAPAARR